MLLVVVPNARDRLFEENWIGYVAEIAACLLLKVDQSVEERSPRGLEADAVGMLRVCVVPDDAKPQPPLVVVVAND